MTEPITVTAEMVQAVRRLECESQGHSYRVIDEFGVRPAHVTCTHCGEVWKVERKS